MKQKNFLYRHYPFHQSGPHADTAGFPLPLARALGFLKVKVPQNCTLWKHSWGAFVFSL